MANKRITQLPSNTTPLATDILPMVDDPGGSPTTQKVTVGNLIRALETDAGWKNIPWTLSYASSTTVTISGNQASYFPVGCKIKFNQISSTKYFYVVSASYSSPNTTLTLLAGTDYTVGNSLISAAMVSYSECPLGFPQWFNFTPTLGNITIGTGGSAANVAALSIVGGVVKVRGRIVLGTSGASISGTGTLTIPTASSNEFSSNSLCGYAVVYDSSAGTYYRGDCWISNTTIYFETINVASTYPTNAVINATVPMTWAASDSLSYIFEYRFI